MLLKRVRLFNIRSYLDETIEFPHGSVLLSGDIGCGKSSILLAVEFALFGARKGTGEALLRNGKKEGFAELVFNLDGKEILIRRTLKRGKEGVKQDAGFVIIDDLKSDLTAEDLKARILNLLGYPAEFLKRNTDILFRYTVYTPQEEMKRIVMEDPEIRLDTLRKVFSVDKYKKINENARIIIKELRERKKELEGKTYDLEAKKAQRQQLATEFQDLTEKQHAARQGLELLRTELSEQRHKLKESERKVQEYRALKQQFEILEAKFSEKYQQVQKLNQAAKLLSQEIKKLSMQVDKEVMIFSEQELEEQITSGNTLLLKTTDKKTKSESKLQHLQQTIRQLQQEVEDYDALKAQIEQKKQQLERSSTSEHGKLKDELKNLEDELLTLRDERTRLHEELQKSQKLKETIEHMEQCPLCLQHVDAQHKHDIIAKQTPIIETLNKHLLELTKKRESLSVTREQLNQQLDQGQQKEREAEQVAVELRHLGNAAGKIEQKLQRLVAAQEELLLAEKEYNETKGFDMEKHQHDIFELNRKLKQLREVKNGLYLIELKEKHLLETEEQIIELKQEVGKINVQKTELYGQLQRHEDVEQKHEEVKTLCEQALQHVTDREITLAELQKELSNVNRMLKTLDEEITAKLKLKERIHFLNGLEHWFDAFFASLMETMEKQVMSRVYQEFNEFFQQWFRALLEDENIMVRLDDTYSPIIEQNGYETSIESLSGGERTSCALAYRLALNKVINDVVGEIKTKDIIILDEPTDGFSSDQLDKVRVVLNQLGVQQVIIVSHEAKIESFVQNVVKIHKEEHSSRVVA